MSSSIPDSQASGNGGDHARLSYLLALSGASEMSGDLRGAVVALTEAIGVLAEGRAFRRLLLAAPDGTPRARLTLEGPDYLPALALLDANGAERASLAVLDDEEGTWTEGRSTTAALTLVTPFEAGSDEEARVELAAHVGGAAEASVLGGRHNGAELSASLPDAEAATRQGTARLAIWGGRQGLAWEADPAEGTVFGRGKRVAGRD
ncbi:MAG: hypothetical protein FJZ01_14795 [Candidatus Sericytochromatia bacterium]|nr:hypothetical protein [Candidatus Tanganyikabacteria bacterium]